MFECEICEYSTDRSNDLKKHNETKKHIQNVNKFNKENNIIDNDFWNITNSNQKVTICEKNASKTCQQIDNSEKKPKKKIEKKIKICQQIDNSDSESCENDYNWLSDKKYVCPCTKSYNHYQNLWRHQQTCSQIDSFSKYKNEIYEIKEHIIKLQEEVLHLKSEKLELKQIVDSLQKQQNMLQCYNNTTNNTTNNNQQFISVFNYVESNYDSIPVIKNK
jgi:hypothetical protein